MTPPPLTTPFEKVSIIGLGLIGGSFIKQLKTYYPHTEVWAFDRRPETLSQALESGLIQGTYTGLDDPRLLEPNQLLLLATHLHQSYGVLKALEQSYLKTQPGVHTLHVMDLGSTKAAICSMAEELDCPIQFVGGHPLAGREISGFENSRDNLFVNRKFLLTPCQRTSEAFLTDIKAWLAGMTIRPIEMGAQQHDQLMSLVSHFPQFYAIALGNLLAQNDPAQTMQFLGGGLDDQLRLMISPADMWQDIFEDNRQNLTQILDQFMGIMAEMKTTLEAGESLSTWFKNSHDAYQTYQTIKASAVAAAVTDKSIISQS